MSGRRAMLVCRPLPRPTWTPPPVVPNPFGDAFEVAAAVLGLGDGVALFRGAEPTPTARRRTFTDAQRLSDFRRQRPDTVFSIRLGDGGGGVVALKVPIGLDAAFGLAELAADLGDLPATVTLTDGVCRWHLYRLPQGGTVPIGKVRLGDGISVRGNGQSIPTPPSRTTWVADAAPGEKVIATLPSAWAERSVLISNTTWMPHSNCKGMFRN